MEWTSLDNGIRIHRYWNQMMTRKYLKSSDDGTKFLDDDERVIKVYRWWYMWRALCVVFFFGVLFLIFLSRTHYFACFFFCTSSFWCACSFAIVCSFSLFFLACSFSFLSHAIFYVLERARARSLYVHACVCMSITLTFRSMLQWVVMWTHVWSLFACVCLCMCVYVSVCVCVCGRGARLQSQKSLPRNERIF
jgi:hypothetical protein